jgi:hypothetical protein
MRSQSKIRQNFVDPDRNQAQTRLCEVVLDARAHVRVHWLLR